MGAVCEHACDSFVWVHGHVHVCLGVWATLSIHEHYVRLVFECTLGGGGGGVSETTAPSIGPGLKVGFGWRVGGLLGGCMQSQQQQPQQQDVFFKDSLPIAMPCVVNERCWRCCCSGSDCAVCM